MICDHQHEVDYVPQHPVAQLSEDTLLYGRFGVRTSAGTAPSSIFLGVHGWFKLKDDRIFDGFLSVRSPYTWRMEYMYAIPGVARCGGNLISNWSPKHCI